MKMASRLIDLITKKQIARAAEFYFLLAKNKFACVARLFLFPFAVVLHDYNAVL